MEPLLESIHAEWARLRLRAGLGALSPPRRIQVRVQFRPPEVRITREFAVYAAAGAIYLLGWMVIALTQR